MAANHDSDLFRRRRTLWLQASDLQGKLFTGFFLLFSCFLAFGLLTGRGREREEAEIGQFVEKLFRDVLISRYRQERFESNPYEG